jgi:regulator of nucleoside diphosphate kinase
MNAKHAKHDVVINQCDFDKLKGLIESPRFRTSHAPLVATLEREIGRGTVVCPTDVPRNVVTMNSKVRFRDLAGGDRETYTLVYPHEADINDGRLSILAPLGTALLGAKVGDVVECCTPGGVRRIKVEKILYQPEAAGDFHL